MGEWTPEREALAVEVSEAVAAILGPPSEASPEGALMDAIAELRRVRAERDALRALVEAYRDLADAADPPGHLNDRTTYDRCARRVLELEALRGQ